MKCIGKGRAGVDVYESDPGPRKSTTNLAGCIRKLESVHAGNDCKCLCVVTRDKRELPFRGSENQRPDKVFGPICVLRPRYRVLRSIGVTWMRARPNIYFILADDWGSTCLVCLCPVRGHIEETKMRISINPGL